MKKFIVVVFTVVIIIQTQFSGVVAALSLMEKLPEGNTEKVVMAPITDVGLNLPLSIVKKTQ